ncbi:MAG: oligosaccharide flippase family protein [Ignavibacteriales bacterium]|jgi:O-antigen/teichoic acid export membrane protein|nr:oligosaccharide flippase family protein [Ignavibacteriaceae bacterium]NLH60188.1 oligosaccharide flippase family protein [Ignavibacteriales bacterium]HOJ17306.1 oligosaccharide flippase family protein [Ignavibacteriaceae bacterium]
MKTDKNSLFASTIWYTIGNVFLRAVNFLLLPLYSNLILPEDFGVYSLILSTYTIVAVIYQGGLQSSLTKFYLESGTFRERKVVFSTILNFVTILSLLLTFIFIIFSKDLSKLITGNVIYYGDFSLIFMALFFETISFYILHLLRTQELSRNVLKYLVISGILNFALNILFVYFLQWGIRGIIVSQLFSSFILTLLMSPIMLGNYAFALDKSILSKSLLFAVPLIAGGIFSSLVDVLDRFLIDYFRTPEDVGYYSFAYRFAMVVNLFGISFRTAWLPKSLNNYDKENYSSYFGNVFNRYLLISSAILVLVSLFIDDLFKISFSGINLFDNKYIPGLIVIPLLMGGYLLNGIAGFFAYYPYKSGKSYHFLISDGGALIINIILNILLIPIYGMLGAALATLISFLLSAIYMVVLAQSNRPLRFDFLKLGRLILLVIVVLLVSNRWSNIFIDIGGFLVFSFLSLYIYNEKLKNILRIKELFNK